VCAPPERGYQLDMADKPDGEQFTKGDRVEWKSHGGTAEGVVEKKITEDTEAAGRTVRASADDPQYLVKSDEGGGEAVHKPGALTKKKK
jgi:Hypervirulence associated proteins TUDOR domain